MENYFHPLKEENLGKIIAYLEEDIANCLYLYIDLCIYGTKNENMQVWYNENAKGAIKVVVMQYYDSFQIYAQDSQWDGNQILALIEEYAPHRISANKHIAETLMPWLEKKYSVIYGSVFRYLSDNAPHRSTVPLRGCSFAEKKDIPEVADLLMTEKDIFTQYNKDELEKQLAERFSTNMGRSLIIKNKDKVVAHIGTFAETPKVAVVSGSVVLSEFRNTDYFNILREVLFETLCYKEQKDIYFFVTNKRHAKLYALQNEECAKYARFVRSESQF